MMSMGMQSALSGSITAAQPSWMDPVSMGVSIATLPSLSRLLATRRLGQALMCSLQRMFASNPNHHFCMIYVCIFGRSFRRPPFWLLSTTAASSLVPILGRRLGKSPSKIFRCTRFHIHDSFIWSGQAFRLTKLSVRFRCKIVKRNLRYLVIKGYSLENG